jgi:hypothetical protein
MFRPAAAGSRASQRTAGAMKSKTGFGVESFNFAISRAAGRFATLCRYATVF